MNYKLPTTNYQLQTTNSNRSYTIVELLIFMGLLSVLLVVVSEVFSTILDVRKESESTSSVVQDGNYLLQRLSYDIARASAINTPVNDGDSGISMGLTIEGAAYNYDLSGGNLVLTTGGNLYPLNGVNTTITYLNFQRIGNLNDPKDTIKLNFIISSVTQRSGGPEVRNFETTVGLR